MKLKTAAALMGRKGGRSKSVKKAEAARVNGQLGGPPTKLSYVLAAMAADNWREALRLAAKFPRLGDDTAAIQRGWEAYARPAFYQELGYDLDALKQQGREALVRRYTR